MTTRSLSYTSEAPAAPGAPPGLPTEAEILGRAAGENFRVASVVLPRSARRHLLAFYGFARLVDQLGDAYPGDRLQALDWLDAETDLALANPGHGHPLVARAAVSVLEVGLDGRPLHDLVTANRMDQTVVRYPTIDHLAEYCTYSANPVGRLVLGAFGYHDEERIALSDSICSGLQLVEHWQDVGEDARAGRVYLPVEDLERFGVDPGELTGRRSGRQLRALMAFEVSRARAWLERGRPLVGLIDGRARWAVAGFWAGGQAALDDLASRDFEVLTRPSRPGRSRTLGRLLQALVPL